MIIPQVLFDILTQGNFAVNKYVASDGSITDLVCRAAGRDGYLRMVKESLDKLEETVAQYATTDEGKAIDPAMLGAAHAKIYASLAKKLEEPDSDSFRSSREVSEAVTPDILIIDNDPAKIALLRLEVLSEVEIKGPDKVVNSKPETLLRNALEELLPISRYRHRVNIYPGKCENVAPAP